MANIKATVHPMRAEAVNEFLNQAGSDWSDVRRLIAGGQLVKRAMKDGTST